MNAWPCRFRGGRQDGRARFKAGGVARCFILIYLAGLQWIKYFRQVSQPNARARMDK